ncbi:hypothetical protein [Hymenobacter sp. UYP22]|uniref:hypothetical protein n=1 Tax=Hymenobacter sp. UYP22 TaxID=3156348 RepID=UPI0033989D6B
MPAQNLGIDDEELMFCILPAIKKSFGIAFENSELKELLTFGQLCAVVKAELPSQSSEDCTTQQAFYKARRAFRLHIPGAVIEPNTKLDTFLPTGSQRRVVVAAIEQELGISPSLLKIDSLALTFGCLLLVASGIGLFFDAAYGFLGITVAILCLQVGAQHSFSLRFDTMRDLAEHMSSHYYRASRRNPATVNHHEITEQLQQLFVQSFGFKKQELTADAEL